MIAFLLPALGGHLLVGRPLLGWPTDWTAFRKVASFSKWTALGGVLVLVIMQSDILILNHLSSAREAGLYSVGQRMALSISVLSNSVLTVLFPHMLAKNDLKNLRSYFNSILRLLPVLPVGIGVAALVASPLVSLCFGSNFALAAPVFIVLFAAFLLSVITNACGYLAFGLDRPEIVTLSLAVQLCVLLVAGVPLATLWGATGVACAVLASRICSLGFTMVPIWSAVRRSRALSVT
ncbi:colanic acid exporter [compost metagenome]